MRRTVGGKLPDDAHWEAGPAMRTIFSIVLKVMVCLLPAVATAEQVRLR